MYITPAFAQSANPAADMSFPLMMLLLLAIFYFLVLRPQARRATEQRERLNAVRRGDTVVTSGGMVGRVLKVSDTSDEIEVELSDTLRVRVIKSTLLDVRSKGEPVKDAT
ncbi:MAG: preprotein translocase subunit YajC [Hyphomicrobium sp.]